MWLAYLVEEIAKRGAACEPWLATQAEQWRGAAAITELGADAGESTDERVGELLAIAVAARQRAVQVGDIPVESLREWIIVDDLPVAGGFSRTGDRVEVSRVLDVAAGFVALLDGSLAPDPPTGAWLFGTGKGPQVMGYRPEFRTRPRFERG
ncbi:MAG TPA: hypothetical protein VM677_31240 [Actinokineospora sp.]|nr:hypothetical protein [Actinokineospora sp.]